MLSHAYTPPKLQEFNDKLEDLLHNPEHGDDNLSVVLKLMHLRCDFIEEHAAKLVEVEKQHFVEHEMKIQQSLLDLLDERRKAARDLLAGLSRKRRDIKKFR